VLIEETEDQQDKSLINHLAKTITENSKVLTVFGISLTVLSKIKSLITMNFSDNYNDETNKVDEEIRQIRINTCFVA